MKIVWQYLLYLLRWQMSSFILAPVIGIVNHTSLFGNWNDWKSAIFANLIGGLAFFWIDRIIFNVEKEKKKINKS